MVLESAIWGGHLRNAHRVAIQVPAGGLHHLSAKGLGSGSIFLFIPFRYLNGLIWKPARLLVLFFARKEHI